MTPTHMTRRAMLGSAAALPFAAGALPATAAAPMQGVSLARHNRVTLGEFDVTTLLARTMPRPDPHSIFGLNVDSATFNAVSARARLPTDRAQFFFTPTVINTGTALVLFDTGLDPEGITAALAAAGYSPDQVDVVVITHMHGDHIGGLMRDGAPTFANATHVTGRVEFDAWAGRGDDRFDAMVRPLADRITMIEDGASVAPGLTAVAAFGHTPGHMAYMVESAGKGLLLGADFANHHVWSLAHPDWEVRFDMDKPAAARTRHRLLDMLASDGLPFIGYHMPWPGLGYVARRGDGYAYQPHSYQLLLDG